jgi:hypothetical protein
MADCCCKYKKPILRPWRSQDKPQSFDSNIKTPGLNRIAFLLWVTGDVLLAGGCAY